MKAVTQNSNAVLVTMQNGDEFLFSYGTCIAGFVQKCNEHFCTMSKYSRATSLHAIAYLNNRTYFLMPQADIDRLVAGL